MLHIISKLDIKYIILKFIEIVFHFIIPNSPIWTIYPNLAV